MGEGLKGPFVQMGPGISVFALLRVTGSGTALMAALYALYAFFGLKPYPL